jgi:hypothetical protein
MGSAGGHRANPKVDGIDGAVFSFGEYLFELA